LLPETEISKIFQRQNSCGFLDFSTSEAAYVTLSCKKVGSLVVLFTCGKKEDAYSFLEEEKKTNDSYLYLALARYQ